MPGLPPRTRSLPDLHDAVAPDGSEIRTLVELGGGSLCHCTLPPGGTSLAVRHRTVEEMWYCVEGRGEVWRRHGGVEDVVEIRSGVALTIPLGTEFQFRTVGDVPLRLLIATMPPWPGNDEAVRVSDHWSPSGECADRAQE
jgi:mannose-6-phosphate isomerase-like protein (cupin superfamily)